MLLFAGIFVAASAGFLSVANAKFGCEDKDAKLMGEYCYTFDEWSYTYWDDARTICAANGAELISIHSDEENEYAQQFLHELMIGLYYKGNNQFEWTDESSVDYLNLADDFVAERSDYNCVKSVYGKWMNFDCKHETHYYLCKKKAISYPDTLVNACPDPALIYTIAGELYSPGYPEQYNASEEFNCEYHLQAPAGEIVVYEYIDGDVFHDKCASTHVYEGWEASENKLLASFTSPWYMVPVETKSSNQMLIVFKACSAGYWKATWFSDKSTPDPTGVPGTTTVHQNSDTCPKDNNITEAMSVLSPGFPFAYDTNIECDFNAYVPPARPLSKKKYVTTFQVQFRDLNIGEDDWIDIIDARTSTVIESTREKIQEGDEINLDFNFVIRFHSGNNPGLFNRWVLDIMEMGGASDD